MTAPARLEAAPHVHQVPPPISAVDCWRQAVDIRREWLSLALSTEPADRPTAEGHLTSVYARLRRPRPRFVWVDSPRQALPLLRGAPTLDDLYRWVHGRQPPGERPFASDLAATVSRLRSALEEEYTRPEFDKGWYPRKKGEHWPKLPSLEALNAGVPPREVFHQAVREAQHTSLGNGICHPIRAALATHGPLPVAWYGQQESWIAHYDMQRRLRLARYRLSDERLLDDWAGLARSCGWWWPGADVCVIVERPAAITTRRVPGGRHEEVELVSVEYRDGWRVS